MSLTKPKREIPGTTLFDGAQARKGYAASQSDDIVPIRPGVYEQTTLHDSVGRATAIHGQTVRWFFP